MRQQNSKMGSGLIFHYLSQIVLF